MEDLRAIRARIVATGDAERRRLERDLHDGAQQRLATLAISIEVARSRADGERAAILAEAYADVRAALAALREVAHGLVPPVLADEGLGPAVEAFAETADADVRVAGPLTAERFAPEVEATAYYVVTEAVRRGGDATVSLVHADGRLVLQVDTVVPARDAIVDLDDRVGALGGALSVETGHADREAAMRVVLADDEALLREGLARLLAEAGIEVVGQARDRRPSASQRQARRNPTLRSSTSACRPAHADDGLIAAQQMRREHAAVGVLVLSHHLESRYAMRLLDEAPERVGYLLKERVSDLAVLVDALRRHRRRRVRGRPHDRGAPDERAGARKARSSELTDREREVLALMAEGLSNQRICDLLVVSPKTVEGHVRQIFMKLGLREAPDQHRRVQAVLAFLRSPQN